ncbi:MAG: hypothetical protein DRO00_09550 [Thermoproteota archaeon]|nr:MAG: hypothetical protein DRO00_09550 [Candidatus Korarchaeota archaeon]
MAATSLLELDIKKILGKAEELAGIKLPRRVLELTLEPELELLCIRYKRPKEGEVGEPMHPQIHILREIGTGEITAVEIFNPEKL